MKKIMFNDKYGLTQAVLDGRKTMTRRIIAHTGRAAGGSVSILVDDDGKTRYFYMSKPNRKMDNVCEYYEIFPKYQVGEEVAIAQPYMIVNNEHYDWLKEQCAANETYPEMLSAEEGWLNKMFVKAYYCYHRIRITNVRVERLHNISQDDVLREGIREYANGQWYTFKGWAGKYRKTWSSSAHEAFAALIDKLGKKGTWDDNPWCFVYEFELIK